MCNAVSSRGSTCQINKDTHDGSHRDIKGHTWDGTHGFAREYASIFMCGLCGNTPCECSKKVWGFKWLNPDGDTWYEVHYDAQTMHDVHYDRKVDAQAVTVERRWEPIRVSFADATKARQDAMRRNPFSKYSPVMRVPANATAKAEAAVKVNKTCEASPNATVEKVARGIFETDPRVTDFVSKVSDCTLRCTANAFVMDSGRYQKAMQTAWDRDERGWRSDAEQRAKSLNAWLAQNRG